MDLERAMEFMLEQQAQFQAQYDARQAQYEERQAKLQAESEAWQVQFREGLNQHDKRLAQAERLLVRGAKMLVVQRKAGRETDRRLDVLIDAQIAAEAETRALKESTQKLEASVQAFIDSMRKSTNGN